MVEINETLATTVLYVALLPGFIAFTMEIRSGHEALGMTVLYVALLPGFILAGIKLWNETITCI